MDPSLNLKNLLRALWPGFFYRFLHYKSHYSVRPLAKKPANPAFLVRCRNACWLIPAQFYLAVLISSYWDYHRTMTEKIPSPLFDSMNAHSATHNTVQHPFPGDYQQAYDFISSYRGSEATFNAYRREIERLLQWSAHKIRKSISDLNRQDIESYIGFCQNPPNEWISTKKCDRFVLKDGQRVPNSDWRPFVVTVNKNARRSGREPNIKEYSLSEKALKAVFAILSSFYNFLIQNDYVKHNPVAQIRQKSKFIRSS